MTMQWREVEMTELRAIWQKRLRENTTFNGHTLADLIAIYGEGNARHVMGVGFEKRVAASQPESQS